MSYGNEPTVEPDVQGITGRAWVSNVPVERPDQEATLKCYILCCPPSNIMWWWYTLAIISLRDIPGVPPAHSQFPGATHEVMCVAMNPELPLPNLHERIKSFLQPVDQVHQVILNSDDDAIHLIDLIARSCCEGVLLPDQDYRSQWEGSIAKTAEHLRLGGHPHPEGGAVT